MLVRAADADELDAVEALGVLASFSMISLAGDGVSVHRLVQAVTLHQLDEPHRDVLRARAGAALDHCLPAHPADPASRPVFARLLPHVIVVLPGDATGLLRTIGYLDAIADYPTAVRLQQRVVDAMPERAGAEDPSVLVAKAELARFTGMTGDAGAARDRYAELLPLFERHFGPEDERTLILRVHLIEWTGEAGARSDAYGGYQRLLPLLDKVLGPDHPRTLYAKMDFANWMGHLGEPGGAREVCRPLLPAAERVWGPEHPDTLTLRPPLFRRAQPLPPTLPVCLAHFTGQAGNAPGARDQYAALLAVRTRVNGPDHPETLATSRDLATWIGEAGDPRQARDRLADLLPLLERAWGKEHPNETLVAKDLHADYTGRAGDPATARRLLADLLPIRERVSGADHPLTRATQVNLARWAQQSP
ncbi:tetratricopeptide repeat protein [Actinoplanes sp. NPDC048791]|uniref:tetratricopeptide repeat protein n=1 Tax=Actinoplanes sp. NPDC048791 TaxID=3154623 RepID=UPI0033DA33D6